MYQQKTEPFDWQREWFDRTHEMEFRAIFWEQGVAKTKPVIDTIGYLFECGEINAALIVAPKNVAPNWVLDELPEHFGTDPARTRVFLWNTDKANNKGYQADLAEFLDTPDDILAILVMSYDALMTSRTKGAARGLKKGLEAAQHILKNRNTMMVLDESARIKNPDTKRTKRVTAAGLHAKFRRIMTGTPVPNSPFDVFAQLRFIDPNVWKELGCGTFAAFKAMFGVWMEFERNDNGQKFSTLVDYQNISILNRVVDKYGDRLLKDDVMNLPPKLYEKRTFTMATDQRRMYDQLKKEFLVWLADGDLVTAPLAITRMLRLQQITSGYLPTDGGNMVEFEKNPRLACLADTVEDIPHQCIIFAKYQKDIDLIEQLLLDKKKTCVVYDGRVSQNDREVRRAAFKAGDAQFFVANPAAAGEGLTLHMAKTVIYYNNSHKLGDRLQSEDRAHRAGMDDKPVLYIDLLARGTIDAVILRALRTKANLAALVMGDKARAWL